MKKYKVCILLTLFPENCHFNFFLHNDEDIVKMPFSFIFSLNSVKLFFPEGGGD